MQAGCDFMPDKEVYTEVVPDLSNITLTINSPGDTLNLYQNKETRFYLNGSGIMESASFVLINGDTILETNSRSEIFTINVSQLKTGNHSLEIISIFSNRTSSLAGQLGLDVYSISRKWVIMVDIDPPTPVQIISIEKESGKPRIKWEKYSRINFQNYQLTKRCYDSPTSSSFITCKYVLLMEKDVTSYLDTDYTSGKVDYIISVTASNQLVSSNPYVYLY